MHVVVEIELACTIHMWIKYCKLVPGISAIVNVCKILHMQYETETERDAIKITRKEKLEKS